MKVRFVALAFVAATSLGSFPGTQSHAATFTVTNTSDSGPGSLRQAVQDANSNFRDASRIEFNIPGSGVHTIILAAGNTLIASRPVTIDGFTQPGSKPNSLTEGIDAVLLIQLRGELRVLDDCVVRGLAINTSPATGLTLQGSGCD